MNLSEALERRATRGPHVDVDTAIAAALTAWDRTCDSGPDDHDDARDFNGNPAVEDEFVHEVFIRPGNDQSSRPVWWGVAATIAVTFGLGVAVIRDVGESLPAASVQPSSPIAQGNAQAMDASIATNLFGPQWSSDQQIILYIRAQASPERIDTIRQALLATGHVDPARLEYLDAHASLAEARTRLAELPDLDLLTLHNIPTAFKVFPLDGHNELLRALRPELNRLPGVDAVRFPSDSLADRLASQTEWTQGLGMVVYVTPGATDAAIDAVRRTLLSTPAVVDHIIYLEATASITDAAALLASDPESVGALTAQVTPTVFKVATKNVPEPELVKLSERLAGIADVAIVRFRNDQPPTR